jgi:uncharacterized MAPEG superfamily protein
MTTDLQMLVWTALLCLVLPGLYAIGRSARPGGLAWGLGNRDTKLEAAPWVERAVRAHANLVENLPPFVALVLVAHVTGRADETTALGASVFFWARVAHAAAYTAGVVYVRTAVFLVSLVGEGMIVSRLFG